MASYIVDKSKHATLTADTEDSVTFKREWPAAEVLNRADTGDIYFTVDGSSPTVGGDDTYFVGPGQGIVVDLPHASQPDAVKLKSSGTPAYSVTGVRP